MTAADVPILTKNQLDDLFDFSSLNQSVELACRLAVQRPRLLYLFMQRYTHFNGYAGSLVARLASSVGLSRDLFKSSSAVVADEADRGLEIAARILAATIDEHADKGQKCAPHRALAQATPVTFRKVVTPWLPFRRPGLRVAPGADRALLLACLSTLLPVDSSNGWHRSSALDWHGVPSRRPRLAACRLR